MELGIPFAPLGRHTPRNFRPVLAVELMARMSVRCDAGGARGAAIEAVG